MLEWTTDHWTCQISMLCKGPEDTLFTKAIKNLRVRAPPESLESKVEVVLFRPELMIKETVIELGSLIVMGIIRPQNNKGQVAVLNFQKRGYDNYHTVW